MWRGERCAAIKLSRGQLDEISRVIFTYGVEYTEYLCFIFVLCVWMSVYLN